MTSPGDTSGNYLALMRERGWSWSDLADEFDRQAQQPALDGGANARGMARWARDQAAAAAARAEAPEPDREPQDPRREPPRRTAVPPRPTRRG